MPPQARVGRGKFASTSVAAKRGGALVAAAHLARRRCCHSVSLQLLGPRRPHWRSCGGRQRLWGCGGHAEYTLAVVAGFAAGVWPVLPQASRAVDAVLHRDLGLGLCHLAVSLCAGKRADKLGAANVDLCLKVGTDGTTRLADGAFVTLIQGADVAGPHGGSGSLPPRPRPTSTTSVTRKAGASKHARPTTYVLLVSGE